MTGILVAMLRTRRAQALLVLVLSALAAAAATAGPAYTAAVDRAVVATEVEQSTRDERTVAVAASVETRDARPFDVISSTLGDLPGFTSVYSAVFPVVGIEPTTRDASFLTFRDDVCAHLTMTAGRCLMASGEVVLPAAAAQRLALRPGRSFDVTYATYDQLTRAWIPIAEPAPVTLVGTYEPRDPDAAYWGRTSYFAPGLEGPPFISRPTVGAIPHEMDERRVEAVAGPDAFRPDGLPALTAALDEVTDDLTDTGSGASFARYDNDVPALLDRIDRSRELSRVIVPVAGLPLVGLCWLVIFLAVAHGAAARRHEQALVALRGSPRRDRWLLAAGESLVAIAVGAPVGYLLGTVGVAAVADLRFDAGWSWAPPPGAVSSALLAVAGAAVVGLLALRRDLAAPVVDLLRRVPARGAAWRSVAIEASAVVLAVVAALQLRAFDGTLIGLGALVPGLVALALAVVAGRLLIPAAARVGRIAVRRGRLALGLGALHLARRPGAQRLFVLIAVAVALLGFATAAVDVAARARAERAAIETGGDRVLRLATTDAATLRASVREVDPSGAFAMAVAQLGSADRPRTLLADTRALPAVADWRPDFGPDPAAEVARRLRPSTVGAVVVRDGVLSLTVDHVTPPGDVQARLTVLLRPVAGGPPIRAGTGGLVPGRREYRLVVDECAAGCRVAGIDAAATGSSGGRTEVTLGDLREATADRVVVPAGAWDTWRLSPAAPTGASVTQTTGGLQWFVPGAGIDPTPTWLLPPDAPEALPALASRLLEEPTKAPNLDGDQVPITPLGAAATTLPGVRTGVLIDLEYAERLSFGDGVLGLPEVWLGPSAPADARTRLEAAGLVVTGEDSAAAATERLDRRGPALAIWFHLLAGACAVALAALGMGLMAAVDRQRTVDDLVALRRQGLRRRTAGRGVLGAYLAVAGAATVTGAAGAALAWWLAGRYLPIFVEPDVGLVPPDRPAAVAVLVPAVAVIVLLTAVAGGLRRALRVRD